VSLLWLFWEIYYQKIGLERLKQCPQCREWFVDRTRPIRKSVAHRNVPGNGGRRNKERRRTQAIQSENQEKKKKEGPLMNPGNNKGICFIETKKPTPKDWPLNLYYMLNLYISL